MRSLLSILVLLLVCSHATAQATGKGRQKAPYHVSWTDQHGKTKCHNGSSKEQVERNAEQLRTKKHFSNVVVAPGKCVRGGEAATAPPATEQKPAPVGTKPTTSDGKEPLPTTNPNTRGGQAPTPAGKEPAPSTKPTTSGGKEPAPVGKDPAPTTKPTTSEGKEPAPVGKDPAPTTKPTTTQQKAPAPEQPAQEKAPAERKKKKK